MKKKLLNLTLAVCLAATTMVCTNNLVEADGPLMDGTHVSVAKLTVDPMPVEKNENSNGTEYKYNVSGIDLTFTKNSSYTVNTQPFARISCYESNDGEKEFSVNVYAFTKDDEYVIEVDKNSTLYINGSLIDKKIGDRQLFWSLTQSEIAPSGLLIPTYFTPSSEGTIYRLLFPTTNKHLYSTDANECKVLCDSGWVQETSPGISATSGVGVYRLYNPMSDEHLFSADKNECDVLSKKAGWQIDNGGNPIFYGVESGTPVYRLYNPTVPTVSSHHYTSDKNEIKVLLGAGWQYDNGGNPVYYLQ